MSKEENMRANLEPVNTAPFLQTIKDATAQLHTLLESNLLLSAIISPSVTLQQYSSYLLLMQHILAFYERDILPLLGIKQRKSTLLIASDLQHLHHTMATDFAIHPFNIPATKITIPFAWGFAYVMEGSKLGGKVIFKNIQRGLGFTESEGATFITDHGANTFIAWKEWTAILASYTAANECEQETIEGAQYTFEAIYNYFELNHLLYEDQRHC